MNQKAVAVPGSNTNRPFIYEIDKIGAEAENVFLLVLSNQMVIYNLPPQTIKMLDKAIDGKLDLNRGLLTGIPSKDGVTYIGIWRLS